jgi:hypothetical protein
MHGEMWNNQSRLIYEGNTVYIRACGSYTFDDGSHYDVLETKTEESIRFPDDKQLIRYMQWPGGKHWYAKCGEEDIRIDGELKWATKELAMLAADKWMGHSPRREERI